MPSLKMKNNLNMSSLRGKKCLSVCQKSNIISKKSCSHVTFSQQTAEPDTCIQKCQDGYVFSSMETIDAEKMRNEGNSQSMSQSSISADSGTNGEMIRLEGSTHNCTSNLETNFSPVLELIDAHSVLNIDDDADYLKSNSHVLVQWRFP